MLSFLLGIGVLVYATPGLRRACSAEFLDFAGKWSRAWDDRWAEEARGRAAGFTHRMAGLGVPLDGTVGDLAALDGFFRPLSVDTYFRAFAMDAGAYVGEVLIRALDRKLGYRWRFEPENDEIVLALEAMNHWVSPISMVAHVWLGKSATTLDRAMREQIEYIVQRLPK